MSMKEEKVSMPMTSAGIIGFSSDMKIAGLEIEPRMLIIATVVFVIAVKIASVVLPH